MSPKREARPTCFSEADGSRVASVSFQDLGELGSGTLGGSVSLTDGPKAGIEIFIDDADLAGGEQPFWSGVAQVSTTTDDRSRGRVTMDALPGVELSEDRALLWPDTLSGTVDWVCDPW